MFDAHGTPTDAKGWTLCFSLDSDRPVYEADLLVCRHCGFTKMMCDGQTKRPLPASAVAEKCPHCDKHICFKCAMKQRSGVEFCQWFIHKVDEAEAAYRRQQELGSYG